MAPISILSLFFKISVSVELRDSSGDTRNCSSSNFPNTEDLLAWGWTWLFVHLLEMASICIYYLRLEGQSSPVSFYRVIFLEEWVYFTRFLWCDRNSVNEAHFSFTHEQFLTALSKGSRSSVVSPALSIPRHPNPYIMLVHCFCLLPHLVESLKRFRLSCQLMD